MDETVESYAKVIAAAQDTDPSGYINTYGTLMCPDNRWGEYGGDFTAIPYYVWNNRGKGEMAVWLKQDGKFQADRPRNGINNKGRLEDLTGWEGRLYRVLN